MIIEKRDNGGLMESYTPGYGGCGCGNRRYYTKDEIDALLAGLLDPEKIEEIINNIFEEFIEEGDLEQLIIDTIAGMYTNEEIDDMLAQLEIRIKNWVNDQGFLKDITITINGTHLHNNDSITISGGEQDLSNYYTKQECDARFLTEHQDLSDYATMEWVESKDYPSKNWVTGHTDLAIAGLFKNVEYNSDNQTIDFYDKNNTLVDSIDASVFITDGIIDDVYTTGSTLVIVFNVDGEERTIEIDFADIFNPDNYYTKTQVDGKFANETARTENAYMKKGTIPYYMSNLFLATSPDNTLTARIKHPDTGEVEDYPRYIKRINDINLITGTKGEDIYLPTLADFANLVDRLAELEARIIDIEDNCCGGEEPPARGTFIVTYNVSSTTQPTKILSPQGLSSFSRAALEDNTTIPIATGYTFNHTGLTNVYYTLDNNTVPAYTFLECPRLVKVTFPSTVQYIGQGAFNSCGLTGITMTNSLKAIGGYAFANNPTLTGVTIPNSVTSIGEAAFAYNTRLKSINIPTGVSDIPSFFAIDCTSLTAITIPSNVTKISNSAFNHTGLSGTVTIPNSVTFIGVKAFFCCSNMTRVVVGTGIREIQREAFSSCDGGSSPLTRITINAGTPPTIWGPYSSGGTIQYGTFDRTNNCPIYVLASAVNAYKTTGNWTYYAERVRS